MRSCHRTRSLERFLKVQGTSHYGDKIKMTVTVCRVLDNNDNAIAVFSRREKVFQRMELIQTVCISCDCV